MAATDELAQDHVSVESTPSSAADSSTLPLAPAVAASADKMAAAAVPTATSLPVTMLVHPIAPREAAQAATARFPGELPESFETALARVDMLARPSRVLGAWRGLRALARGRADPEGTTRVVGFDGFRSQLYDEKIERDRRYGTVYTVREERNAYLVRLEMPRRVPASALKATWGVSDEMPDYDCRLQLEDQVLSIRASVAQEAIRRLAYVSSSFPPDFLTRIEFAQAAEGFVHRLRDRILEVIVFKRGTIRA